MVSCRIVDMTTATDAPPAALDPGRAAIHLGWKPWTTIAEGAAAVIEYFRGRP